ncbi:hypothetical protein DFA_06842 [Cavenderia fasciculata]|uniref:Uncharacterized protein n=1 Tax=Cavenderia fasciculata TaxID=261658 RepID=F4Q2F5_CACFS|nr:uncharacterized protein DFA_06842 [Cavenderia fasciculata]EGG18175.1 hypothetical protein DFA_06842 [Cavenderia fasciculata]|eukprot:XP_004366216.1 hypothetical protein DFA_06842 [Cavenderia fasciculata]
MSGHISIFANLKCPMIIIIGSSVKQICRGDGGVPTPLDIMTSSRLGT